MNYLRRSAGGFFFVYLVLVVAQLVYPNGVTSWAWVPLSLAVWVAVGLVVEIRAALRERAHRVR